MPDMSYYLGIQTWLILLLVVIIILIILIFVIIYRFLNEDRELQELHKSFDRRNAFRQPSKPKTQIYFRKHHK